MPLLQVKATVTGKLGVNLRSGLGTDRDSLILIPLGAELTVYPQFQDNARGYDWIAASYKDKFGFVAKGLVKVTDVSKTKQLYVGIHVGDSGNAGEFIPALQEMAAGGFSPPCVLVINDAGLCRTIKEIDKNIIVIFRYVQGTHDPVPFSGMDNNGNGTMPRGRDWFNTLWREHQKAAQWADLHQMYNESGFQFNAQNELYARRVGDFELEFLMRADEMGVKATFGNYFPGTPEAKHWEQMHAAFSYARNNRHWLLYHAYDDPELDKGFFAINAKGEQTYRFFGLRPMEWLDANYPTLNVVSGESARFKAPRYRGEADFVTVLKELQALGEIANTSQRKWYFCKWLIKGQNDPLWTHDDFTPLIKRVYVPEARKLVGK